MGLFHRDGAGSTIVDAVGNDDGRWIVDDLRNATHKMYARTIVRAIDL
jgi:hypothetical protein